MINGHDPEVAKLRLEAHEFYEEVMKGQKSRKERNAAALELAKNDRFFLLVYVLRREDCDTDWVFARCREVEMNPDGYLDIWAREHYKSSIISYAGVIQEHLRNPDATIAIFSFNRPIAKGFARQVKYEYEHNEYLRELAPHIFWENTNNAPKWSEDDGLVLRRQSNKKEASLEAWGLIDGQPTSKHFDIIIYNDIVTADTVSTPDMIRKTTIAWENSLNLSTDGGILRYEGTFWNYADTYNTILERGAAKPRIYPATDNGHTSGNPVLFSNEYMRFKLASMSSYVAACQLLCNPKMGDRIGFDIEWLRYWKVGSIQNLNIIIVVDPATTKRDKQSDYTVFWVVGLGPDQNYYVLDIVRDRMGLYDRAKTLFQLHTRWRPGFVLYEEYAMQSDIEYIIEKQNTWNYRFHIQPVKGRTKKEERIERLQPLFREQRIFLPESKYYTTLEGDEVDLIHDFIYDELVLWPYSKHDDMLDSLNRILDGEGVIFPSGGFDSDGGEPDDMEYNPWTA